MLLIFSNFTSSGKFGLGHIRAIDLKEANKTGEAPPA